MTATLQFLIRILAGSESEGEQSLQSLYQLCENIRTMHAKGSLMTDSQTALMFRGTERIMIVAGSLMLIVFGMKLFKWGAKGSTKFTVEAQKIKLNWTNASPGSVVMLFGMIIFGWATYNNLIIVYSPNTHTVRSINYKGELNKVRDFLSDFKGNEAVKLTDEQVTRHRRTAGILLTKLDELEQEK